MQIGPSLSLLQALGSQPGAPERVRLQPTLDAEAAARQQQASAHPEAKVPEPPATTVPSGTPEPSHASPGRRLDIRV